MNYDEFKLEDIVKKKRFIYQIDGQYYVIGARIFKELSNDSTMTLIYESYAMALKGKSEEEIEVGMLKEDVIDAFRSLRRSAAYNTDVTLSDDAVLNKLDSFTSNQKSELLKQMITFIVMNRRFNDETYPETLCLHL